MGEPLTPREHECLAFIKAYINEKNFSPTLREIAQACGGITVPRVSHVLDALEEKKYLSRAHSKHRSIKICPQEGVVTLNPEIDKLVSDYCAEHGITKDVGCCELLRGLLGAV